MRLEDAHSNRRRGTSGGVMPHAMHRTRMEFGSEDPHAISSPPKHLFSESVCSPPGPPAPPTPGAGGPWPPTTGRGMISGGRTCGHRQVLKGDERSSGEVSMQRGRGRRGRADLCVVPAKCPPDQLVVLGPSQHRSVIDPRAREQLVEARRGSGHPRHPCAGPRERPQRLPAVSNARLAHRHNLELAFADRLRHPSRPADPATPRVVVSASLQSNWVTPPSSTAMCRA